MNIGLCSIYNTYIYILIGTKCDSLLFLKNMIRNSMNILCHFLKFRYFQVVIIAVSELKLVGAVALIQDGRYQFYFAKILHP